MLVAWRNMSRDRTRFALTVAAVAVSILMILLLRGYLDGTYRQASAYFENAPGSLIVAQGGTRSGIGAASLLPDGTEARARALPGVARVAPVLAAGVVIELHGRKQYAMAIGYDRGAGGGPWRLADGREPGIGDEVVVDRVLAQEHGLATGDRLQLLGRSLEIVGTSEGTTYWIGTYVFVTREGLAELTRHPAGASFLFVSVDEDAEESAVRTALAGLPGTSVLTKPEIVANQRRAIGRIYDAPLGLMVVIAFSVGVLVVGLVVYAATLERRREYGMLKAIGGSTATLYRVVALQALLAAVGGGVLGIALAFGIARLLVVIRPQFNVVIEPWAVGIALGASVVMALLAALVPSRSVAMLPPTEVLRS